MELMMMTTTENVDSDGNREWPPPTSLDPDDGRDRESGQQTGGARPKKHGPGILRIEGSPHQHQHQHQQDRPGHRRKSSSASADYRFASLNPNADQRSPLPSADRLSVTFNMADESSIGTSRMGSPVADRRHFHHHHATNPHYLDLDDEDEDEYSMSAASILQQRQRGSGGRSSGKRRSFRRGASRRTSSPFPGDEFSMGSGRRRGFSVATVTSSEINVPLDITGDGVFDERDEQVHQEHVAMHKEVIQHMRYQPWDLGKKLRVLRKAKEFVRQHEGALKMRLAESRNTKDVFARGQILVTKGFQTAIREVKNLIALLVPWESRIKEIESLFGSAVASYFTFLRWVFWINIVLTACYSTFVVVPEVLATEWDVSGERKGLLPAEKKTATDLQTLWDFEGILKYSPIFYGFYSNAYETHEGYKLPFAYFFTGLVLYFYSFVAILRKMAKNSRLAKLSDKEDECTFTWKLFTGWDFMIGHPETGENRRSAITLGFKEALLEEKEKERATEKLTRNVILRRITANFLVLILLCSSAYLVVLVVERSTEPDAESNWWRQNEITVVLSLISIIFPNIFELIGIMEKYHPRRQLRWQLARIMILNLLNLYTLIFALFGKVNAMTTRLAVMKANISQHGGLNLLDATDAATTTPWIVTSSPAPFNFTTEDYYAGTNVTESIVFILNATEHLVDVSDYAPASTTTASFISTVRPANQVSQSSACFQVIVDCALLLDSTAATSRTPPPYTTTTPDSEYDDDYDDLLLRSKRQADGTGTTAKAPSSLSSTSRTTPQSIGRLLDSLSAILRTLTRNATRTPGVYLNRTFGATTDASTSSSSITATTPESFDELMKKYTSALRDPTPPPSANKGEPAAATSSTRSTLMTTEDASGQSLGVEASTASVTFAASSSTDESTGESMQDEAALPTTVSMCPMVVCPWNDTVGHFNGTSPPPSAPPLPGAEEEEDYNATIPCRGDNPQGCTPYWTSSRDEASSTVVQSTVHSSSLRHTTEPTSTTRTTEPKPTLDPDTRLELRKLCWETMFGQELVKLTIMDLVFTTISILIIDFIRAVFVRMFNGCWCWDLEKYFPQYGEFKIAENILHLVNNQGMIWMGMFFSPGLPAINVVKLFLLLYIRSWAVLTCNVPHEVIFRASRSNNFYLWLLLIMLFLCTLPVAYAIVWLEPSWHCGPFSDYSRMFHVMTQSIVNATPQSLHWVLSYIASPGVVIPLLVLLVLVIYYLVSLSSSLRETVTDLRTQMRRERDAERMKTRERKEMEARTADADADAEQPVKTLVQGANQADKIIAQWRKAVPFGATGHKSNQQNLPQLLAKEAADKRLAHPGTGGGGRHQQQQQQQDHEQRAGSSRPRSSPPKPVGSRAAAHASRHPTAGARSTAAAAAPPPDADTGPDGSDLDISESLPRDVSSPVLTAAPPPLPPVPASPPAIYAVVRKSKPSQSQVAPKKKQQPPVNAAMNAEHQPLSSIPPRSPVNIPLIRISQTESVERAERAPPPQRQPAIVEDLPMPARRLPRQEETDAGSGLTASSPTKSGALNLILQKAKERVGIKAAGDDALAEDAKRPPPVTTSGSTADLIDNMEETDVSTVPDQQQTETQDSASEQDDASTIKDDADIETDRN